jgi:hypothetical protein
MIYSVPPQLKLLLYYGDFIFISSLVPLFKKVAPFISTRHLGEFSKAPLFNASQGSTSLTFSAAPLRV